MIFIPLLNCKMIVVIPHNIREEEALQKIQKLLQTVKEKFADKITDPVEKWTGNKGEFSFKLNRISVSGIISVKKHAIDIKIKLPFFVHIYKGQIRSIIEEQAKKALS